MTDLTDDDLTEIEARADKATPGPWEAHDINVWNPSGSFQLAVDKEDAAFIAHARTDVPRLVAEVRRLRNERDAARAGRDKWEHIAIESQRERDQLRAEVERLKSQTKDLEWDRRELRAEVKRLHESAGFWGRSLARESLKLKAQEQEVQRLRAIVMAACDRQAREMDAEGYVSRCSCGLHGKATP